MGYPHWWKPQCISGPHLQPPTHCDISGSSFMEIVPGISQPQAVPAPAETKPKKTIVETATVRFEKRPFGMAPAKEDWYSMIWHRIWHGLPSACSQISYSMVQLQNAGCFRKHDVLNHKGKPMITYVSFHRIQQTSESISTLRLNINEFVLRVVKAPLLF